MTYFTTCDIQTANGLVIRQGEQVHPQVDGVRVALATADGRMSAFMSAHSAAARVRQT